MGIENRQYYRDDESLTFGHYMGSSYGAWSMVTIIIVVNVAVFALDMFAPKSTDVQGMRGLMRIFAMDTEQPWYAWTWLTHGFAHASLGSKNGVMHILFNMVALFFLGKPIEQRLGRWEFLKFYLMAIIASGLAFLLIRLAGGNKAVVVGASGAVSAVVALFIFCYPRVKLLLMGIIPMPAWVLGCLLIVLDFSRAFDPTNNIAWEAHIAGAAFGAAYFYFGWNFSWFKLEKLAGLFDRKPSLKIHNPDRGKEKLQEQADVILAKINEHGEESLTGKERRILNRYSKQLRNR